MFLRGKPIWTAHWVTLYLCFTTHLVRGPVPASNNLDPARGVPAARETSPVHIPGFFEEWSWKMDGRSSRSLVQLTHMLTWFGCSWLLVPRPEAVAAAAEAGAPHSPPSFAGGHANSRGTESQSRRWYQRPKRVQQINGLPVGWLKELVEGREPGVALGRPAAERQSTQATEEQTPTPSVSYHIQVLPESVFSVGMATFSSNVQRAR